MKISYDHVIPYPKQVVAILKELHAYGGHGKYLLPNRQGKRVGIASNSHKAINNLLLSTAQYCREQGIDAHFACTKDTESALAENGVVVIWVILWGDKVVGRDAYPFATRQK